MGKEGKNRSWYKQGWTIVLFIIVGLAVWFYFYHGFDKFNYDEEAGTRTLLTVEGYEVTAVGLNGTSAYVEMKTFAVNNRYGSKNNFNYTWQVWDGLNTLANAYEVDPYDIEEMPKNELRQLGINPNEVPYMSDEELLAASEIIGMRASTYIVKIHAPLEVCSYRLSRATYRAWDRASEIDVLSKTTALLYDKMENEIKNSENCS